MAVQSVLEEQGIDFRTIELGRVDLTENLSTELQLKLNVALKHYELELMDDKRKILVERIKTLIFEKFHYPNNEIHLKLSTYLSKNMHYEYTYLSNTFSETEGITIERFFIVSRIERAKELLVYEDLSISEIAYQLNFSSASHFCLQFKKVTGQTPSMFKKLCESEISNWRKL